MTKFVSKKTRLKLNLLGIYQIAGGLHGLALSTNTLYHIGDAAELFVFSHVIIACFFCYSIFCGMLCLTLSNAALKYTLVNQSLQSIGIAISPFVFKYVAGVYFVLGLDVSTYPGVFLAPGLSQLEFSFVSEDGYRSIEFNLIALILVFLIAGLIRKFKEEENIVIQISTIGKKK